MEVAARWATCVIIITNPLTISPAAGIHLAQHCTVSDAVILSSLREHFLLWMHQAAAVSQPHRSAAVQARNHPSLLGVVVSAQALGPGQKRSIPDRQPQTYIGRTNHLVSIKMNETELPEWPERSPDRNINHILTKMIQQ